MPVSPGQVKNTWQKEVDAYCEKVDHVLLTDPRSVFKDGCYTVYLGTNIKMVDEIRLGLESAYKAVGWSGVGIRETYCRNDSDYYLVLKK